MNLPEAVGGPPLKSLGQCPPGAGRRVSSAGSKRTGNGAANSLGAPVSTPTPSAVNDPAGGSDAVGVPATSS